MVDSTGNVVAKYKYDLWGVQTKESGTKEAEFGYGGYYVHRPSGLYLTWYRQYDGSIGRMLSRDPIEEDGGLNLYSYVENTPTSYIDPFGLKKGDPGKIGFQIGIPIPSQGKTSYGYYCGKGSKETAVFPTIQGGFIKIKLGPIDEVDACCQDHDKDYRDCGNPGGFFGITLGASKASRDADSKFVDCLRNARCELKKYYTGIITKYSSNKCEKFKRRARVLFGGLSAIEIDTIGIELSF